MKQFDDEHEPSLTVPSPRPSSWSTRIYLLGISRRATSAQFQHHNKVPRPPICPTDPLPPCPRRLFQLYPEGLKAPNAHPAPHLRPRSLRRPAEPSTSPTHLLQILLLANTAFPHLTRFGKPSRLGTQRLVPRTQKADRINPHLAT